MNNKQGHTVELTRNQSLVLAQLGRSNDPLTAYSLLDKLRDQGIAAPQQVYRALAKLTELGVVHRLESLNAFVACQRPECGSHAVVAFAICAQCGSVIELADDHLPEWLQSLADGAAFSMKNALLEISGVCLDCEESL